ncbi:hypothetical protein PG988_005046 [Apiospora saccharicola]
MASYQESEHFAEDFREALEDLQVNNRYDIQNLTMIARENTEHALAIAQTLQNHIKRVASHKKLPSLYVLDSIIKNVGTPYTLFFGKRLFETYMDAYASVDMATRRKMDEMLKTWKEPIPGSIDTRPVFPPDVTRPIENALIKARTSAMAAQQQHYRNEQQLLGRGRPMPQQPPVPYRNTPTPPNVRPSSQASGYPGNHSNGAGPFGPPAQAAGQYPQHQCTQCGRRFKNDAEGKTKKTAHMDWHFKVNQRIAEADKAGQNRGWLVDEQDWLGTRETIDVIGGVPTAQSNATQGGSVAKAPKMQYIPVPDDPVLLNSVCPICQEKFKQVYLDEEWVWEDALCVGDRIYHASCHREATGGSSSVAAVKYSGGSRGTPEPVLGKRKAEQDDLTSLRAGKLKMEA